jgi:hypothetical protein
MGLVASMPMDDWPEQHAEVDVGWAATGPTGWTGQPGAAATSTAPAGPASAGTPTPRHHRGCQLILPLGRAGPASHGWMSMSVSFIRRRAGGYQAASGPHAGSEAGQAGGQVVGGGMECLVGHRVERVEDEQRRGGVVA